MRIAIKLCSIAAAFLMSGAASAADYITIPVYDAFDPKANAAGAYRKLGLCGSGKHSYKCMTEQQWDESRRSLPLRRADARWFLASTVPPGRIPVRQVTPNELSPTFLIPQYGGQRFRPSLSDVFEPRVLSLMQQVSRTRMDVSCVVGTDGKAAVRYVASEWKLPDLFIELPGECSESVATTMFLVNLAGSKNPAVSRLALVFTQDELEPKAFNALLANAYKVSPGNWRPLAQPQ